MNSSFSGLQKLEQRAKKCIELRGEYVEYIPSFVTVVCFIRGRANNLSAPRICLARIAVKFTAKCRGYWRHVSGIY